MLKVGGIEINETKFRERFESLSRFEIERILKKRYKVSFKSKITSETKYFCCEKREDDHFKHGNYYNEFTFNSFRAFMFYLAYLHPGIVISDYELGFLEFEVICESISDKINKLLKL